MTSIAAIVRELVAAGLTGDALVQAVERIESASDRVDCRVETAAEKRRAWDRDYRRRKREIHPSPPDNPPDAGSALSLSTNKKEPKEEVKKERKRGEKIPPDWTPNVGHLAAGANLGFTERQIAEQAEDMRLWAQSNEHRAVARKADWNLTFLAWLRRNKPNGKANGHGRKSLEQIGTELAEQARELERDRGLFRTDDPFGSN